MKDKEPLEQFNSRIPRSLKNKLKEISFREGKDQKDIIIELIKEYCKIHGFNTRGNGTGIREGTQGKNVGNYTRSYTSHFE